LEAIGSLVRDVASLWLFGQLPGDSDTQPAVEASHVSCVMI